MHIRDTHRHLGGDAGDYEALPQGALLLDAAQALVHVAHVHAGAQVFHSELAQTATVRAGHLGRLPAGRGRGDQFGQGPVEDGRLELVERLPDVEQQPQVDAELGDGLERSQSGLADESGGTLEQAREFDLVDPFGQLVRRRGVRGGGEGGSVPGRVARSVAEFTECSRLDQGGGGGRPTLRQAFERASVEPGRGRGR